ncbi:MAG: sugar ABC transporter permease [Curvibacter sp. RIFCSPHIGHO2_12_FULL_63_18]|uniref:ABC transporter permease n=1 Tax=Rhodoferax sp. TaxID=50421 RepID=UPI0008CF94CD|nr:ABC transporter permease [Rhodoferax sp.]OGO99736.1 MAG: sugar ABC transporter permease [Curvibacter sp. RIFCSPHIGHO2_12_FULL_63_18]OGP00401.1 MAG: sugar ABC transporter permease [Curvibacter sp. GWA2_63_95]HCX82042.1 sugar ABC transporter permease [Rhodoferax sp.]
MSTPNTPSLLARVQTHPLLWPVVTLVLILMVNASLNPGFWMLQWRDGHLYGSVIDILNRAAPLMLVSLGMTLVIATRGIDISVGATVAISAAVAALMVGGKLVITDGVAQHISRFPMWLAIVCALLTALACGLWNGVLVAKIGLQPIIATLILMVAGRGVAQLLTDGQIVTVYYPPYFYIGSGYLWGLPFALFIAAFVYLLMHLAVTRTALGLFIQAIGINPAAARVAGVRERLISICVYAFCGLTAGIAGLIISSNVKSADGNNAGNLLELDAILAVTLGGTLLTGGRFSLAGSMIGALIIQTLTSTIYSIGVPPEINLVVKAAVVFVVMLMQSAEFRRAVRGWVVRPHAGSQA